MAEQPLFPLRTVLFPDGLLELKIFEARYLDLMSRCLRERAPFGVVALRAGSEARGAAGEPVQLYEVGTLAELIDVDSAQAGILLVRCRGTRRFVVGATRQERDGLWLADTTPIDDDPPPRRRRARRTSSRASPTPSRRSRRKAPSRSSRRIGSTTPAGSPTAGARSCRCRWRRSNG